MPRPVASLRCRAPGASCRRRLGRDPDEPQAELVVLLGLIGWRTLSWLGDAAPAASALVVLVALLGAIFALRVPDADAAETMVHAGRSRARAAPAD